VISVMALMGVEFHLAQANTPLPTADWYAVAHVPSTDTLHWINENGEQGTMPRPQLLDEMPQSERGIHISPDGQYMVMTTQLVTNRLGLGFYNFQTGQWIQTHQAEIGEALPQQSQVAFSTNGTHVALTIRHIEFGVWRILVFETATGNAVDILTADSLIIPDNFITDLTWWPIVAGFYVDDSLGQAFVNLQQVTSDALRLSYPSFRWYHNPAPIVADAPIVPDDLFQNPYAGYDIIPTTQAVAFTGFDTALNVPSNNELGNFVGTHYAMNELPQNIISGTGYTLSNATWLRNGEWIGYRTQNNQQPAFYSISDATVNTSLPLGTNIQAIHNTPDGFIAVDSSALALYHTTTLDFDAFSALFGNTIFTPNAAFNIVYTTPISATFTLDSLPSNIVSGNDTIQPVPINPTATPLQVQPVPINPTATPLQVQPVPINPTATPLQVQPVPINPTATPLQVQPVPINPTATPLQVQPVPINPTATPMQLQVAPDSP